MRALAVAIIAVIATVVVLALTGQFSKSEATPPFKPIYFTNPVPVQGADNEVPDIGIEELPAPSFEAVADTVIPLRLTRYVDCATHDCPQGGFAVRADVAFVEVNSSGIPIGSEQISVTGEEGFETNYDEGVDYDLGGVTSTERNLNTVAIPQAMVDYLIEEGKEFSAWQVEGSTVPTTSSTGGEVEAGWTSEVFHVYLPKVGG